MKKDVPFQWDEACSNAFNSIKSYLMKAPVLAAPIHGKPLLLYIATQELSVGALLAQENNEGKEVVLYYLSRIMTPNELNYSPIEKLCLALIFAIQKLKHYFQAHSVRLISRANPIKYVMSRPVLSDRLARWYLQLQQFEIIYVPQKAVKGQVLANFLANHPIPAEWELSDDLPDEDVLLIEIRPPWKMYFDGAAHRHGAGAGIVFITPDGGILLYSFTLNQHCSNNVVEYQALILGFEIAVDMEQLDIQIYGDSLLVVNQLLGSYEVKKSELIPYHKYATQLIKRLGGASIKQIPRKENKQADALAVLASSLAMSDHEIQVRVCQKWVVPSLIDDEGIEGGDAHVVSTYEIDKEDWRQPLVHYLKYQKLPEDQRRRTDIRRRAPHFILYKDTLYRKSFESVLLHCLSEDEAYRVMHEAHSGICGAHQSGSKLHFWIKRMGYYWSTMVKDCIEYAQKCQTCQFHANYIHQPPEPLHPTVASWPFDAWGLDVQCKSSMYNAPANGLAEAFNKILCSLLKKVVAKSKKDWHERIGKTLWAYRTTYRTPTQATPYALVYGVEAVLPLEQQIPSLRIAIQEGLTEEENVRLRLEELEVLEEKRLEA
ncbi:uncharacterized protein [Coffea arabica]|uniref:RNase H type-1 domain-containing protein n=1 Tax=Coffea arabica TaxID=13443 RepID=A0ABM4U532_COFAR